MSTTTCNKFGCYHSTYGDDICSTIGPDILSDVFDITGHGTHYEVDWLNITRTCDWIGSCCT